MSDEEQEYEVESIVEAEVQKKRGRGNGLVWRFRVRWKGYKPEDDTWEPIESFDESEHIVNQFWERTRDTRDIRDLSLFHAGEKFLPLGPPRRKAKRKSLTGEMSSNSVRKASQQEESSIEIDVQTPTSKRRRGIVDLLEQDRPTKRSREMSGSISRRQALGFEQATNHSPELYQMSHNFEIPPANLSSKRQKKKDQESLEVIPDSDEEVGNALKFEKDMDSERAASSPPEQSEVPADQPSTVQIPVRSLHAPGSSNPSKSRQSRNFDSLFDTAESGSNTPAHRSRAGNHSIQVFEDPNLVIHEGQLSAKSRALGQKGKSVAKNTKPPPAPSSRSTRSRPGPGRSSSGLIKKNVPSLLTAGKDGLKTVKGVYHSKPNEQNHDPSSEPDPVEDAIYFPLDTPPEDCNQTVSPPKAGELLALAGFDAMEVAALPEFEDDMNAGPVVDSPKQSRQQSIDASVIHAPVASAADERLVNLNLAKENLFPSSSLGLVDAETSVWKQATIFGPLGLDSEYLPELRTKAADDLSDTSAFSLNLDSSISIPVIFCDAFPVGSKLASDIPVAYKAPPGKFYHPNSALAVLDTIRTGGASGRVLISSDAADELKLHFAHFLKRLEAGDLFVGSAGVQIYAFCSSSNALVCQRLNISPSLQVAPRQILVAKIVVENYSGYADAAAHADTRQWSQYVATAA